MSKIVLMLSFIGLSVSVFGQNSDNAEIVGTWTHEGGLVYQFNADGTFSMSVEGGKAEQDAQSVQDKIGKVVSTRTEGTYTVTQWSINMIVMVNGKSRRMRMAYRKIDPDTLRLGGQDYRRERDGCSCDGGGPPPPLPPARLRGLPAPPQREWHRPT
jgi:hypothetical protein